VTVKVLGLPEEPPLRNLGAADICLTAMVELRRSEMDGVEHRCVECKGSSWTTLAQMSENCV